MPFIIVRRFFRMDNLLGIIMSSSKEDTLFLLLSLSYLLLSLLLSTSSLQKRKRKFQIYQIDSTRILNLAFHSSPIPFDFANLLWSRLKIHTADLPQGSPWRNLRTWLHAHALHHPWKNNFLNGNMQSWTEIQQYSKISSPSILRSLSKAVHHQEVTAKTNTYYGNLHGLACLLKQLL